MHEPTVLITGGAKGLGREFAEALGAAGARLAITGRDQTALEHAQRTLAAQGFDVLACQADVLDRDATRDVVGRIMRRWGRLDVLVNNAADPGPVGPTAQIDLDAWSYAQQVNVVGPLLVAQAALKVMIPAAQGRIINVVSPAGVRRWPYATAYAVSKAALIKLSENLAVELKSTGISMVAYSPGIVDAGLTRAGLEAPGGVDPWQDKLSNWARKARDEGRLTSVETATNVLVRIALGEIDVPPGQVVHADDDRTWKGEATHAAAYPR